MPSAVSTQPKDLLFSFSLIGHGGVLKAFLIDDW